MNSKIIRSDGLKKRGILSGDSDDVRQNIKYVRKLRGYTQNKMAKEMGITQSAISQFESNGNIQFDTLVRIGKFLDVNHLLFYMHDLHDECAPYHEIIVDVVKSYPNEEQFVKVGEAMQSEIEERRIGMYTGKAVAPEEIEILDLLNKLNIKGQREAVKRVEELTQLEQYKRED